MLSLPIYGLIALGNKQYHLEAALKYFILSAIFSGILLYGLSLLYGATGSLDFKSIINFIALGNINNLFKVGMILLFIGLFFKLNLVPFHLWVPDVYQGAVPTIGMLIATIPKITTIAILGYLLQEVFNKYVNYNWQNLLIAISLSSIIIGNLGAILQNNLKRLLGYAAVAHSGFMLLGLATNQKSGMFAANLYVIVYSFMVIGIFGTVAIFANNIKDGQFVKIDDFAGLANQHPWFAGILLIILLSMAGVPPTVGFYVKFLIIKELIAAKLTWVAIVSLLLSLMAWFYYLKIIKSMYFIQPDLGAINKQHNISISNFSMGIITMNAILILATSILPIVTNYNYIHFLY
jgi:NADH-quinone oxidoreductase subunit N